MLKFLVLSFTFNFIILPFSWGAVQDIKGYKNTFSSILPTTKTYFEKPSRLKPLDLPLGTAISYDKCQEILKRISNKPADLDCGDESNNRFFQKLSTKNQFDLPTSYLLQFSGEDGESQFTAHILLDSHYKLLEATSVSFSKNNTKTPAQFSIFSRDREGNVYENILSKNQYGKTETRQGISLSDGTIPRGIQTTYPKNKKSNTNLTTVYLLRPLETAKTVKNPFELPSSYESYVVTYENGKERCASVKIKVTDKTTHLPSETEWDKCSEAI